MTPRSTSNSFSDSEGIEVTESPDETTITFPNQYDPGEPITFKLTESQHQKIGKGHFVAVRSHNSSLANSPGYLAGSPKPKQAKSYDPLRENSPGNLAGSPVIQATSSSSFFTQRARTKLDKKKQPQELHSVFSATDGTDIESPFLPSHKPRKKHPQPHVKTPLEKARRAYKNKEPLPELEEVIVDPGLDDNPTPTSNSAWEWTKKISLYGLSFVTALPTAINSLAMASGMPPEKLGRDWWNNMSAWQRIYSIANMSASLGINSIMNFLFIPKAWEMFSKSFTRTFDGPKEFFDNFFSALLGLGAALAAAVIGYNAFLWLPQGALASLGLPVSIPALIPAMISAIVTLTTRYVGVTNVLKRIHTLFSKDAKTQAEFANALNHIEEEHLNEVHARFERILVELEKSYADQNKPFNHSTPLTNEDFEFISTRLAQELTKLAEENVDLMDDTTNSCYSAECTKKNALLFFDLVTAIVFIGLPAGLTFMEKGWKGAETMASFAKVNISDLNIWIKRGIGFFPGLASAMLYADSASNFRAAIYDLAIHLYENPKDLAIAIPVLIGNGFAASSSKNLADGVFNNPHNITGVHEPLLKSTAIILNAVGGGVVNTLASGKKALPIPNKDAARIQLSHVTDYLSRGNDNPVKHGTADAFNEFLNVIHPERDEEMDKRPRQVFLN